MLSNAHCSLISTGVLWKSLTENKSLYCKVVATFDSNLHIVSSPQHRKENRCQCRPQDTKFY